MSPAALHWRGGGPGYGEGPYGSAQKEPVTKVKEITKKFKNRKILRLILPGNLRTEIGQRKHHDKQNAHQHSRHQQRSTPPIRAPKFSLVTEKILTNQKPSMQSIDQSQPLMYLVESAHLQQIYNVRERDPHFSICTDVDVSEPCGVQSRTAASCMCGTPASCKRHVIDVRCEYV